ncbi:sugar transferase [Haloarcula amylovorans]|uniref:sugar transferase n=1 Tax=Haloarcula amylovorans TaxID=2562280 RepID=UPI001076A5A2|nr:sugar transferase [Halomicroarcula amylolytica]
MKSGWRYRFASVGGAVLWTVIAVAISYHPLVQTIVGLLPVVGDLPIESASGAELGLEIATTAAVVLLAFAPLYRPQPRRFLDTWMLALQRTGVAVLALAAIGYFDYTYRLPRATLIVVTATLGVGLPAYFVAIRRRPTSGGRAVVVGDSPEQVADVLDDVEGDVLGYVAPAVSSPAQMVDSRARSDDQLLVGYTDGGQIRGLEQVPCLGGLPKLETVLVENDVDTAVLAFDHSDRSACFGAMNVCYEHGVAAKIHRDHADSVLSRDIGSGNDWLVDIDLDPWDIQDRVFKRAFDAAFAVLGLLALLPVMAAIAAAIKLEDGGPVFYRQKRTATLGETFTVSKFRTMVPDAESESGATISVADDGGVDPRVTSLGRVLRPTHLDEIPQLWAVLRGDMSVVGPRPERPELDADIEADLSEWRSRWFVKPGLTGLAQINGVTGYNPHRKLKYDIEYIRNQSITFDLKIVVRQLFQVVVDARTCASADGLEADR